VAEKQRQLSQGKIIFMMRSCSSGNLLILNLFFLLSGGIFFFVLLFESFLSQDGAVDVFPLSGSPGYLPGAPVLAGTFNVNTSVSVSKRVQPSCKKKL
jgi:hypothetical protein